MQDEFIRSYQYSRKFTTILLWFNLAALILGLMPGFPFDLKFPILFFSFFTLPVSLVVLAIQRKYSMKFKMKYLTLFLLLICLFTLAVSTIPGTIIDLMSLLKITAILLVPILGIVGSVMVINLGLRLWKDNELPIQIPWKHITIISIILIHTLFLLKFYIPLRIGFLLSQSTFESQVELAPVYENRTTKLNEWLGFYYVDRYAKDKRGGVYFRVNTSPFGYIDRISYGFCYQPNSKGTPFGAAGYRTYPLGRDWYWFKASDDFY